MAGENPLNAQPLTHEMLLSRFVAWAERRDDIRAARVISSRARVDRPADQWSDMDSVVVTSEPQRYLADGKWLEELALPWLTFLERGGAGEGKERRALFENVVDLDFIPFSTDAAQAVTKHG